MRLRVISASATLVIGVIAGPILGQLKWHHGSAYAQEKPAATARTESARLADDLFWQTFHSGQYENIQHTLEVLTAEYLKTPNDAVTAAHVAWLHTWRAAEASRKAPVPATITDDIVLARKYFQTAVARSPAEARNLGFLASMTLAEGGIDRDGAQVRRSDVMLQESIRAWPEFNLFTAGYVMSREPANSDQFKEGLNWQWQNLDVCVDGKVDRADPDFTKYAALETTEGPKRACWNTWIAPHNVEGFFLNMGDMLVKAGDWQVARKIYANAKISRVYQTWKYRDVLEDRIQSAEANVAEFNAPPGSAKTIVLVNSAISCMVCHQQ